MGITISKNENNNFKKLTKDEILSNTKECPICFEKLNNFVILDCNHVFCLNCIQKTCISFIDNFDNQLCPICRKQLSISELKKIYENWTLRVYHPKDWVQYNTVENLNNLKISKFCIQNINSNSRLLIPYYNHNNFNKPLFFHSAKINILNSVIDGYLDNIFCLCIDGILDTSNKESLFWYNYVKKNFSIFKIKNKSVNIENSINYSKIKIRFCIKNLDQVVVYNIQEGSMEFGLKIYEQPCKVLFRTYLYQKYNDTFLINELYSICYL